MSSNTDQTPDPYQLEALSLTNRIRQTFNYLTVCMHPQLNQAARNHTIDMSVNSFLSTTGNDGASPIDRIRASGYDPTLWGMNIMYGSDMINATAATEQLYTPSTPNQLFVNNANFTHVGIYRAFGFCPDAMQSICTFWTIIFAATSSLETMCLAQSPSSGQMMMNAKSISSITDSTGGSVQPWSPLVVLGVILGSSGTVLFLATLVVLDHHRRQQSSLLISASSKYRSFQNPQFNKNTGPKPIMVFVKQKVDKSVKVINAS